ncbi:MAG: zinc ribbon domain-containing protein [Candidatus Nanoarchaeia archaeon]|nr:zinc ribbon domain-containing protein [Candidatus Nanoarchaeia archaeon]MDD5053900.1 zinc ribbon domain-containing protein [Candidatus Nanoarchaeia archaeon]MDD5499715.1 zinc ribbon domain-containing protein [Candidatus Nanoarchaeia archaeon]
MGMLDNLIGRVKSDLSYRAGSEISDAVTKGASKILKKNKGKPKCPKCKKEIPEGLKFCPECGAKLTATCVNCNMEFPIKTKFCTSCGGKLE